MRTDKLVHEYAPPRPKFAAGTLVKIDGYFGVREADDPRPANGRVVSLRLLADVDADWDGEEYRQTVTYPKGWEYLVVREADACREWGWVTEADLVRNGYAPAAEAPALVRVAGQSADPAELPPDCLALPPVDDETVDLGAMPRTDEDALLTIPLNGRRAAGAGA